MSRTRLTIFLQAGCLFLAACADPATPSTASPSSYAVAPFQTEPLALEWQARARALVSAASLNPLAAGRVYAAVSVAQYHALNGVASQVQSDGQLTDNGLGNGGRSRLEAQRGAVAGASARVLGFLFSTASASLADQVAANGSAGPGNVHPHFNRGVAIGNSIGDAMVDRLKTDGFTAAWTGNAPVGPEFWVAVSNPPSGATLGAARSYFLTSGSQFRPAPPPAYLSAEFNAAVAEVLSIAQNRTPVQIASALFWNFAGGTPTATGYWNQVAADYSREARLDETATARVFALMQAAIYDAQIACWDAKYEYWTLRPYQANPSITRVLPPPNHPSFPSGHSCVSAAAGTVLSHFFPQHASELATAVAEAGMSRIYAGIHYRFDITAGNAIGNAVGQLALNRGL
jgi:membrane-associated phospholipid phosphatase